MDGIFYPYIGTWENVTTSSLFNVEVSVKSTMTLEKEAFTSVVQMKGADTEYADISATKGTFIVESKDVTMTTSDVKTAVDGTLPAEWTALTGDDVAKGTGEWSLDGDKLTLTFDGTAVVYTKVE